MCVTAEKGPSGKKGLRLHFSAKVIDLKLKILILSVIIMSFTQINKNCLSDTSDSESSNSDSEAIDAKKETSFWDNFISSHQTTETQFRLGRCKF